MENLKKMILFLSLISISNIVFADCFLDPDPECEEELDPIQSTAPPIDDYDDFWWDLFGFNNGDADPGNSNAQACFDLNQDSPNEANPGSCLTDPGNADEIDYSDWITDNLANILYDCFNLCEALYPNISDQLAIDAISAFARSFYQNYDYMDSRSEILNMLVQVCVDNYPSDGTRKSHNIFMNCLNSQLEFFYSLAPSGSSSIFAWLSGVSINTPFGSLNLSPPAGINSAEWMTDLLAKVEADRLCHTWYQALAAAGCFAP